MKNLHLLPTDKPSRLRIGNNGNFILGLVQDSIQSKNDSYTNQNIYITSNEEIKVGDWVYCNIEGFEPVLKQKVNPIEVNNNPLMKKIILTTDQDLIKDGVQPIDDDFLKWFVKNSSCERVDVEKGYLGMCGFVKSNEPISEDKIEYKIIIPKEESKLNLSLLESKLDEALSKETEESLTDWVNGKRSKQETIEEAAFESSVDYKPFENDLKPQKYYEYGFINGAKSMAEKMYSEEEVEKISKELFYTMANCEKNVIHKESDFEKWFNQFKKK